MKVRNISTTLVLLFFIHCSFISYGASEFKKSKQYPGISIRVYYDRAKPTDTLELNYYSNFLLKDPIPGIDKCYQQCAIMNKDGSYHFSFRPGTIIGYFDLEKKFTPGDTQSLYALTYYHLIEAGDEFTIKIRYRSVANVDSSIMGPLQMTYSYSGKSAKKYQTISRIDSIINHTKIPSGSLFYEGNINPHNSLDQRVEIGFEQLARNRKILGDILYEQLKTDVYSRFKYAKYGVMEDHFRQLIAAKDTARIALFCKQYISMSDTDKIISTTDARFHSYFYCFEELHKLLCDDLIENRAISADRIFKNIVSNYQGIVRDKLLVAFIEAEVALIPNYKNYLVKAKEIVKSGYGKNIIQQLMNRRRGQTAFDFKLTDSNGKIVSLNDFAGKFVFIDFWFTGCAHCENYFKQEVSNAEAYFTNNKKIVFISVSIDKSLKLWKNSIKSGLYTSENAINLYTGGHGIDDPVIVNYAIDGYPSPMLIGPSGKIIAFGNNGLRNENRSSHLIETINEVME